MAKFEENLNNINQEVETSSKSCFEDKEEKDLKASNHNNSFITKENSKASSDSVDPSKFKSTIKLNKSNKLIK